MAATGSSARPISCTPCSSQAGCPPGGGVSRAASDSGTLVGRSGAAVGVGGTAVGTGVKKGAGAIADVSSGSMLYQIW